MTIAPRHRGPFWEEEVLGDILRGIDGRLFQEELRSNMGRHGDTSVITVPDAASLPSCPPLGQYAVDVSTGNYYVSVADPDGVPCDTMWQPVADLPPWTSGSGNPRGLVAEATSGGSVSCPAGVRTYVTAAVPITLLVGRKYRLEWQFRAVARADNSAVITHTNMTCFDGATDVGYVDQWHGFGGHWSHMTGFAYRNGDGVARSLRLGFGGPLVDLIVWPTHFGIVDIGGV